MKKALVLNVLSSSIDVSWCNLIKRVNWLKCMLSSKQYHENELTEKFNNISSKGFVFQDEKVLPHNLYIENVYDSQSVHGVYRFTDAGSAKYQIYFGPIIEVSAEDFGCLTSLGCKGIGWNGIGCKGIEWKSLGCRSKGDHTQYVNFLNNAKNQQEVQVFNNHFGLRKEFDSERDDYAYSTFTECSLNELVKDHYEKILSIYNRDVEKFYQQGMGFIKTIDTPSFEDIFTQAMLFGSTSDQKAIMADLSSFKANVRLSRFDVWYFPMVKGLIRRVLEHIPIIKKSFSEEKYFTTSHLYDSNIAIVENVYSEDFNSFEDSEIIAQIVQEAIVGKIPVTLAVKRKFGFWKRIFRPVEYDFHTYLIDAIKG